MSPDAVIAEISTRQAYINEDGTVEFLIKAADKSALHPDATLDESNWGVTIADLGESISDVQLDSPFSWGGHAVVVIETIEDGVHHMWRGDLVGHSVKGTLCGYSAEIRFGTTTLDSLRNKPKRQLPKDFPRTETWIRTKSDVQKLKDQIVLEAEHSKKKEPIYTQNGRLIKFAPLGGSSVEGTFNCIEWAKDGVTLANIKVPDLMSSKYFISTPTLYTGSKAATIAKETLATLAMSAKRGINLGLIFGGMGLVIGGIAAGPLGCSIGGLVGNILGGALATGFTVHEAIMQEPRPGAKKFLEE
jgi:hypothetical protein